MEEQRFFCFVEIFKRELYNGKFLNAIVEIRQNNEIYERMIVP